MARLMTCLVLLTLAFQAGAATQTGQHASVKIVSLKCSNPDNMGPKIQGEIKNIAGHKMKNVALVAKFTTASGKFVSSTNMVAKFNPLMSGQVSPFSGFGDHNPRIHFVQIQPVTGLDGNKSLSFVGKQKTTCPE